MTDEMTRFFQADYTSNCASTPACTGAEHRKKPHDNITLRFRKDVIVKILPIIKDCYNFFHIYVQNKKTSWRKKNTKQLISPSDLSIDDDCAVKVFCLVGGVFEFAAAKLESLDNGMELSTSAGIFIFPNVISVKEPSTEAPFPKKY